MSDSDVAGRIVDRVFSGVEFHAPTGTYRTEFDWHSRLAADAVVSAVAVASGRDPLELEPLFEAVDPDALNGLFTPSASGVRRTDVTLSFEYEGYEVTVRSHGTVQVGPPGRAKGRAR